MDEMQAEPAPFDKEELLKRHRFEKKELQNKIQSMKKSIPKGDKKMKKDIGDEITNLEKELEEKHSQELGQFQEVEIHIEDPKVKEAEGNDETKDEIEKAPLKISRAQRRRNKKDTEAKEREKRILDQAERNKEGPRILEMNTIKKALQEINLQIHNIPADGNCLYLAVKHQLQVSRRSTHSVNELRKKTANFMRAHKDDFLPFMYNEDDESEIVSEETFESYCKDVEKTKLWGGQLELKALSNVLSCPIKVIQATGPPTVQGENFKGPELILTYHRHLYRLGEHYNSTLPLEEEDDSA
ncbi:deubiquitinase OTUD6B [Euwallacea fornicatus]|uniref:deubiquitinase OTUD6B n=1 Tax=Euwallacea fornicatus TaxID=995702 RepID=UPI00338FCE65